MGQNMLKSGLVSVTFRKLSVAEVAQWAYRASLSAIEWGGDVHVPHGDIEAARGARAETIERGLVVSSYGSYYRIGESEKQGLSFDAVLDTALELETEMVRVWAGSHDSQGYSAAEWSVAVEDARRICQLAAVAGVTIALEYHGKTITNTLDSTLRFLQDVSQANLKTYWQPRTGVSQEQNMAELTAVLPYLANVHVFQWTKGEDGKTLRHALSEGREEWAEYLKAVLEKGVRPREEKGSEERYALLEFVKDDEPKQLFEDADVLTNLLEGL
jgi:3-dehydroshikimate dehydratase